MKRFRRIAFFLVLGLTLGVAPVRASPPKPLAQQALPRSLFPQEFQ
ncbi:hypothetical protein [Thermoflexus sp.]